MKRFLRFMGMETETQAPESRQEGMTGEGENNSSATSAETISDSAANQPKQPMDSAVEEPADPAGQEHAETGTNQNGGTAHDLPSPGTEGVMDEETTLVHELEAQLQESRDKHLRLLAEFDNFKRRSAKERNELRKTAAEDLIVDLLGVLDDFNRAKSALEAHPERSKEAEGFLLIAGKLRHVLDQRELKAMNSKGQPFDPEQHEAITEVPAPSEELKGCVVDVVEEGYILGDKIIRYAKVVVGK
ncbi:MAG: nucleotide exchange factor GrpE [Bacteroidetes bacterium]|nr:nucleotide exchange factor GrpE [Bacteroidota bacterium]